MCVYVHVCVCMCVCVVCVAVAMLAYTVSCNMLCTALLDVPNAYSILILHNSLQHDDILM